MSLMLLKNLDEGGRKVYSIVSKCYPGKTDLKVSIAKYYRIDALTRHNTVSTKESELAYVC